LINAYISFPHRSQREGESGDREHGAGIKIKLRAPALEGKANAALRKFLAEELKISEHQIVLKHGQKSRDKAICIDGLSEEDMRRRLLPTTH
jgi:uncharacterized protein